MRPLRFVALSEDGTHLVLAPDVPEAIDNGERFALPVDERLRAASRGDVSRLGQIEIELESNLRPREIQSRIRSGETPESVASAANVRLEKVMRYAYPVLQERAQIAERAQQARVKLEDSTQTPTLSELVASRLNLISVDPETVEWDARRLDDGAWEVRSSWQTSEKTVTANWRYDVSARTVTPGDRDTIEFVDPPPPRLAAVPGPPVTSYDPTEGHDPYSTYDIDDTTPTGPIPLVRTDQRPAEPEPAAPFGRNRRAFRQRRDREPAAQERMPVRKPEPQYAGAYDRRTADAEDDLVGIDDLLEPDVPEIEVPEVSAASGPPPGVRETVRETARDTGQETKPSPPEPAPARTHRSARGNRNSGRVAGSLPGQPADLVSAPDTYPLEAPPARETPQPATPAAAERAPEPEPDEPPPPPQPATSRGGKPRIPSWDDIVFGVKRNPK